MYSEVFPSRLKKAREEYGLTQVEASKLLKIDKSTLAKYELGQREPNIELLVLIAVLYNVSLDWLCGKTADDGINRKELMQKDRNRQEMLKKVERDARHAQKRMAE